MKDRYAAPSRTAIAISRDGATVVFSGETKATHGTATPMLYRRPLAETQAVALPGAEGAEYPFFSPDDQADPFLPSSQVGNFNCRSIAWKRGSLRKGSSSESAFSCTKAGSRSRNAVSSHSSAWARLPHCA